MDDDSKILSAAFRQIKALELLYEDSIPWGAIKEGFVYSGDKVLLANQVQGIFKPRIMIRGPMSIKTTIPKGNRENIYNDQLTSGGYYRYSLEEGDPHGERNVLLWQALNDKSPFIYFHAVAPAIYKALWPCFVGKILPNEGYAEITIGKASLENEQIQRYNLPDEIESKYIVRETVVRLHQASFREAVLNAYHQRCAITGLPVPKLLEAAHIIADREVGDMQTVSNGIALSRLHHRAYDTNLIGIDPDYKVHVSQELRIDDGGPLLKSGILDYDGRELIVPKEKKLQPNRDYLARRFETFQLQNHQQGSE